MFNTKFEFLNILKTKTIKMSRTVIVNFEMVYKIEFTCSIFTNTMFAKKTTVTKLQATRNIQSKISKRTEPSLIMYLLNLPDWLITLWKKITKTLFKVWLWIPENVKLDYLFQRNLQLLQLTVATILSAEILKIKTKYTHFELSFAESKIVKQPMLK